MDKQTTISKTLLAVFTLVFAVIIAAFLLILFRKKSNEKFSAENFASAVVSQNPKVFERLAEM